jgi:hypothetical protein
MQDVTGVGLVPRRLRPVGFLLALAGAGLAVARFRYGVKPAFLDATTFAIRSTYLETRSFALITNNLTDELAALLLLAGLVLLAFAQDRDADPTRHARCLVAWRLTGWIHAGLAAMAIVFLFGMAFNTAVLALLFTPLLTYVVICEWSSLRG